MLAIVTPWMVNIALTDDATSRSVLHNMFYLTIRFGDEYVTEIEQLWSQLVSRRYVSFATNAVYRDRVLMATTTRQGLGAHAVLRPGPKTWRTSRHTCCALGSRTAMPSLRCTPRRLLSTSAAREVRLPGNHVWRRQPSTAHPAPFVTYVRWPLRRRACHGHLAAHGLRHARLQFGHVSAAYVGQGHYGGHGLRATCGASARLIDGGAQPDRGRARVHPPGGPERGGTACASPTGTVVGRAIED